VGDMPAGGNGERLMARTRNALHGLTLAATLTACVPAFAQNVDFSRKTITIYIGNTAGGSYDLYGRMVARFLGKHLPGNPTVIATNMPGAGTLRAANYIYEVAPKDGTAIGIVTETVALEQAVGNPSVQYDAAKLNWMGRIASSNNIHFQWYTAKVQSVEEAKKMETSVGAAGAGNLSEVIPKLLNKVIGTKFKVISGYPASAEAMLAMERGEVEGAAGSWAAVRIGKQGWLQEKKIKIILQDVPERSADLPDVPALGELGDKPEDKKLLNLYASGGAVGRSFILPPGVPDNVLKTLQAGFMEMTKDPEMIAEMQKTNLDLEPLPASKQYDEVRKTLETPASIINEAKSVFGR
jgi:tripartite-type tricarboxylate transporter receptor subunit TctC